MALNVAYADITATPVTTPTPGEYPEMAMAVDNDGCAVLLPTSVSKTDKDVVVTIFRKDFTVEKQFTIKNIVTSYSEENEIRIDLENLQLEPGRPRDIYITKNFFVKNDKWCIIVSERTSSTLSYKIVDEDGNDLGAVPCCEDYYGQPNALPIIYLDDYFKGTPYLISSVRTSMGDRLFQVYTLGAHSSINKVEVENFTSVHPNPFNFGQNVTVKFDRLADEATFISVVDISGRQVYHKKIKLGENIHTIPNISFSHGHYIYTIIYKDGNSISGKLLAK